MLGTMTFSQMLLRVDGSSKRFLYPGLSATEARNWIALLTSCNKITMIFNWWLVFITLVTSCMSVCHTVFITILCILFIVGLCLALSLEPCPVCLLLTSAPACLALSLEMACLTLLLEPHLPLSFEPACLLLSSTPVHLALSLEPAWLWLSLESACTWCCGTTTTTWNAFYSKSNTQIWQSS